MLNTTTIDNVHLAVGVTDLRKSIDGLSAIVQESFELNPFSQCLFVFCNRKRDKIKILHWEYSGFWLYYKRLEKGKFQFPDKMDSSTMAVTMRELRWLLDGLALKQKQAHPKVTENVVI